MVLFKLIRQLASEFLRKWRFSIFFLFISFGGFCKTTSATSDGDWTTPGIWNNGVPVAGDVININAGVTVTVSSIIDLINAGLTTVINISGTISFDDPPGALNFAGIRLDGGDAANVATGGAISNADALGGFLTFGTTAPLYLPAILVNVAGVTTTSPPGNTAGDITGPVTVAGGTLPIELISFISKVSNDRVELDWTTASELNNDFFTIERASDIEKFEEVTTVKGQGTTNSKTDYSAVDESPLPGVSYYRLKQTDFDGKFTYSDVRKVEVSEIKTNFRVYPNPVIDNKFNLELNGIDSGSEVPVRIVNMQGASVFEASYQADQHGRIKATIELNLVSSGMYMVVVNAATGLRTKIVIP